MAPKTIENSHWGLASAYDGDVDRTEDEYGNSDACANNTFNRSEFIIFGSEMVLPMEHSLFGAFTL